MTTVELNSQTYEVGQVIECLSAQVTSTRWARIQKVISQRDKDLIPVMENIYDRGNTSAVMRSAEAFGFFQFHQIINSNLFKESKRVTKGADKWLVQKLWPNTEDCVKDLKKKGYKIYVTHLEEGTPIDEVSFDQPVALCFGNEKDGASGTLTKLADEKVYLPMQGFVQSFNISVAAALCFQHIYREHQLKSPSPLSYEERQKLTALYLYRSLKNPDLSSLNSLHKMNTRS